MKSIVIVGSINMDLVCRAPRIPTAGETVMGSDLQQIPGGKGANQAVAAARLASADTRVHMIGRVGDDGFGTMMRDSLQREKVDVTHVSITPGVASGCALILVDDRGENSITVAPGANSRLTPADIDAATDVIRAASCVVMQLEIPLETVRHTIELCRRLNVQTILDPAPVPNGGLPRDMFAVDVLTPNQTEAALLLKESLEGESLEPSATAMRFLRLGARGVVLKLGGDGSLWATESIHQNVPAFPVKVVDTTAAGDAFTAGLATGIAEGMKHDSILRFANAAGAICCTTFGAQPALPTRAAVEKLLATHLRV
jgi:ribokinase